MTMQLMRARSLVLVSAAVVSLACSKRPEPKGPPTAAELRQLSDSLTQLAGSGGRRALAAELRFAEARAEAATTAPPEPAPPASLAGIAPLTPTVTLRLKDAPPPELADYARDLAGRLKFEALRLEWLGRGDDAGLAKAEAMLARERELSAKTRARLSEDDRRILER